MAHDRAHRATLPRHVSVLSHPSPIPRTHPPTPTDLKSADAIITNMLYLSPARQLLYVSDIVRPSRAPLGEQQHLACFLAGLLALGAAAIPPPHADPRHAWAAQGLAHTCWLTYAESRSGLGPEHIAFPAPGRRWVDALDEWDAHGARGPPPGTGQARAVWMLGSREYRITDGRYMLRPEVRRPASCGDFSFFTVMGLTTLVADTRELVHSVADDGRSKVARPRVGDFRGYRKARERGPRVCVRAACGPMEVVCPTHGRPPQVSTLPPDYMRFT